MYRVISPDDVHVETCYASHWEGNVEGTSGQFAYGRLSNYPYLSVGTDGKVTDVDAPVWITDRGWELLGSGLEGIMLSTFCAMAFLDPDEPPVEIWVDDYGQVIFEYELFNEYTGACDKVETEHVADIQQD